VRIASIIAVLALGSGCSNGQGPGPCTSTPEQCNARDDDCDGEIDEADSGGPLRRTCSNQCGPGEEECSNGAWVFCDAPPMYTETCNGADDDCDGRVDEDCPCVHGQSEPCGEAIGVCPRGTRYCQSGAWGVCQLPYDPETLVEVCNDGLDNDCDGSTDEECTCSPGETQSCGSDVGECQVGLQTCDEDAQWIEDCVGEVGPAPDICDGLDNDCDGEPDFVAGADFGWRSDDHEVNDSCDDGSPLYNSAGQLMIVEGGETVSVEVDDEADLQTYPTLYPPGDEDWYSTRVDETTDCWNPFGTDCAFRLTVQLWLLDREYVEGAVQDPDDWRLCITLGGCMDGQTFCSHGADWFESESVYQLAVIWGSPCYSHDPRDLKIRVHSPTGAACGHYQLYAWFEYDDTLECPE
jgi:hypothetical protein